MRPRSSTCPCPECGRRKTRNRSTITKPDGVTRYRVCVYCGTKFKTHQPTGEQENVVPLRKLRGGHNAKLTPDDVREIRRWIKQGVSQLECALAFDVSQSTIRELHFGRTWTHVA